MIGERKVHVTLGSVVVRWRRCGVDKIQVHSADEETNIPCSQLCECPSCQTSPVLDGIATSRAETQFTVVGLADTTTKFNME